jgi:Ricin-type beta-trefoil lectin domain-like
MLAGIAVVLILAGAGATVYVAAFHQPAARRANQLPSRAVSTESVGLVAASAARITAGGRLLQLTGSHASPEFSPLSAGPVAVGSPQWTADLMGGKTYIFIFLATDSCLTAAGPSSHPSLALRHCDLGEQQRWRRLNSTVVAAGHDYYQYANAADGRCLSMTGRRADGDYGTGLTPCSAAQPASQLLAFWRSSL